MNILLIVALVIAGAAVIYYFIRKGPGEDLQAKGREYEEKGFTPDEGKAKAAYDEALEALKRAQEAEDRALVQEQADIVRMLEERLKALQTSLILQPDDPALQREAEEAEARAIEDRRELERRWTEALTITERELAIANKDVAASTEAYESARAKVAYWENRVAMYKNFVMQAQRMLGIVTIAELRRDWETKLALYRAYLKKYEGNVVAAKNTATAVRAELIGTVATANLVVEAALRTIADIRLLGILMALANRVDGIAKATRTKLRELEVRLKERV